MREIDRLSPQGQTFLADHFLRFGIDLTVVDDREWRLIEDGGQVEIRISRAGIATLEALRDRPPDPDAEEDHLWATLAALREASPSATAEHLRKVSAGLLIALAEATTSERAQVHRTAAELRLRDPALRRWWAAVAGAALVAEVASGGDPANLLLAPDQPG